MNKKIEKAIRKELSFLPKDKQDAFLEGFEDGIEEGGVINKLFAKGVGMAPQGLVDKIISGMINDNMKAQLVVVSAFSGKESDEIN